MAARPRPKNRKALKDISFAASVLISQYFHRISHISYGPVPKLLKYFHSAEQKDNQS